MYAPFLYAYPYYMVVLKSLPRSMGLRFLVRGSMPRTFYFNIYQKETKMNIFENMTSEKVESKGQSLIKAGRLCMLIGLCALAMFFLILIIAAMINGGTGIIYALAFDFDGYEFGIPFMVLSYLGMLVGICGLPIYISGLNLFTLARIAVNTEKN